MKSVTRLTAATASALFLAGAAGSPAQVATAASAEAYPSRPIRIVIPYPPGGTSDILARLIGSKLTESWKQQVIVDNRTGASGNIGLEHGARATPDAHTFVLTDIGNAVISQLLFAKLPFHVLKALGLAQPSGQTPVETIATSVGSSSTLIVLDNCEHLDGVSDLTAALLAACPNLRVLATSRAALGLTRHQPQGNCASAFGRNRPVAADGPSYTVSTCCRDSQPCPDGGFYARCGPRAATDFTAYHNSPTPRRHKAKIEAGPGKL